jgi:tight adherence protein B
MNTIVLAMLCGLVVAVVLWRMGDRLLRTNMRPIVVPSNRQSGLLSRLLRLRNGRRHERTDWAAALDQVAAELRTGSSLSTAVCLCPAFGAVGRSAAAGENLVASLERIVTGRGLDDAESGDRRLAIGSLIAVAHVGGSGGLALERTADTIRERNEAIAERIAQSAQARLSAVVLSALPAAFAVWSIATDGRVRTFLLRSPLGATCLAGGALLNVVGWLWMKRLAGATA